MTNEAFYDAEIAPELLRLGQLCQDRGMSLMAVVEHGPGEVARTTTIASTAGYWIRLVDLAARSKGNADTLILAMMRHAGIHGHASLCLSRLGVPDRPAAQGAGAAASSDGTGATS